MRTLQLSITLCLAASFAVAAPNPPEKSKLFERRVDPESGVVSFILKPKIHAFNQQSIYFTCKSMSDDGRFLLFHSSPGETGGPKVLSLVDLEKDEISDISMQIASSVVGREINEEDHKELIDSFIDSL